ncbi:hypothetical protein [Flagellimonas lutaonensis]|uniref:Lipoprotein n=1 Tax=Flagellimonas lutaonensis TaxID=516051 RepID=A0A0D5YPW5_9FLAO|nr:hypothetical protein [Allomuricauda lutaonensis]AKA34350.1 hypothetical protein VC82_684 [Allomuricauda lutaonensis]
MRKLSYTLFIVFFSLVSCSESLTVQESEAIRVEALASNEYKMLRNAYEDYFNFKMGKAKEIIEEGRTNKISIEEFVEKREAYLVECANRMKEVAKRNQQLFDKFPQLKKTMDVSEILEDLQQEFK